MAGYKINKYTEINSFLDKYMCLEMIFTKKVWFSMKKLKKKTTA